MHGEYDPLHILNLSVMTWDDQIDKGKMVCLNIGEWYIYIHGFLGASLFNGK